MEDIGRDWIRATWTPAPALPAGDNRVGALKLPLLQAPFAPQGISSNLLPYLVDIYHPPDIDIVKEGGEDFLRVCDIKTVISVNARDFVFGNEPIETYRWMQNQSATPKSQTKICPFTDLPPLSPMTATAFSSEASQISCC